MYNVLHSRGAFYLFTPTSASLKLENLLLSYCMRRWKNSVVVFVLDGKDKCNGSISCRRHIEVDKIRKGISQSKKLLDKTRLENFEAKTDNGQCTHAVSPKRWLTSNKPSPES